MIMRSVGLLARCAALAVLLAPAPVLAQEHNPPSTNTFFLETDLTADIASGTTASKASPMTVTVADSSVFATAPGRIQVCDLAGQSCELMYYDDLPTGTTIQVYARGLDSDGARAWDADDPNVVVVAGHDPLWHNNASADLYGTVSIDDTDSTYTVDCATERTVRIDATNGVVTVDFPAASTCTGKRFTFKAIDATNTITLDPDGSETIDGSTTDTSLSAANDWIEIESDGSNWVIVNQNAGAGGGGAPTDAQYWVGAADGTLSAEIVVNDSSGLASALSDETGSGFVVFSDDPAFTGRPTFGDGATAAGGFTILEDTDDGAHSVTIQAQAMAASYTLTLPVDAGSNTEVLTTDGSGNLSWSAGGGGGTPGGSDTQVQYNDGGSSFGGAANLLYNDTTGVVTLTANSDDVGANNPFLIIKDEDTTSSSKLPILGFRDNADTNLGNIAAGGSSTTIAGLALRTSSNVIGVFVDDSTGYVEIGGSSSSPTAPLHIRANSDDLGVGDPFLVIEDTDLTTNSITPIIEFQDGGSSMGSIAAGKASSSTRGLVLRDSSDAVTLVSNETNGHIGIGPWTASDPPFQLSVKGEHGASELSADPSDPAEGHYVIWMSDGTGSGDDGDIMMKITAGAVTKTITLVDFSAF